MSESPVSKSSRALPWAGWALTLMSGLGLLASAVMKFVQPPGMAEGFQHLGFPMSLAMTLGVIELVCVVVYLVPPTAGLGAILLTGYLGGAVCTHLRVGDPVWSPLILGVLVWGGLYFRDARVRALIPFRR